MAKNEAAAPVVAPDQAVADAPESEARAYFSGSRTLPADKPANLTRQQWGMLREHVAHGRSYADVGKTFGGMGGDKARSIIGDALERIRGA